MCFEDVVIKGNVTDLAQGIGIGVGLLLALLNIGFYLKALRRDMTTLTAGHKLRPKGDGLDLCAGQ